MGGYWEEAKGDWMDPSANAVQVTLKSPVYSTPVMTVVNHR